MQHNVTWVASLILGSSWRNAGLAPLCYACARINAGTWRFLAHGSFSAISAGKRRTNAERQEAHTVPYLATDDFGRPTVVHRSSVCDADEGDGPSRTPYDATESLRRDSRIGKFPAKAFGRNQKWSDDSVVSDNLAENKLGTHFNSTTRAGRAESYTDVLRVGPLPRRRTCHAEIHPPGPETDAPRRKTAIQASDDASGFAAVGSRASGPVSSRTRPLRPGTAMPSQLGPASRDRMLTFRLLKASSLGELEQLLRDHPTLPNMIHLAATARQAVLLGSLSQSGETRELLDRQLQRLVNDTAAAPAGRATAGAGSATGGTEGESEGRQSRITGHDVEDRTMGVKASRALRYGDLAAGDGTTRPDLKGENGAASSHGKGAAMAGSLAAASLPPLRELADVLWAYGKLQCKPPHRVWSTVLRPLLLDPTGWQKLKEAVVAAEESGEQDRGHGKQRRRGGGAPAASGEDDTIGRELSKVTVALARMRELDAEVWGTLARIATKEVGDMSPRALASTLWAFGSVRMTHGSLLAASVRSVQDDLRRFNGQDLVCIMWALSRMAPPLEGINGAAVSKAAAAASAARGLLYGDLSDAARRCLQLRGVKPTELTTLVGVLDELAEHQQLYPRSQHVSARLLRVVSQAVRKNLSSLPVGALVMVASAFQRVGHHDAALYQALGGAMVQRLRHMESRHLLRATTALQDAGLSDRVFFAKMLEAAQSRLGSFRRHELLAMVEVCSRMTGGRDGGDEPTTATTSGMAITTAAVARAFIHAAILHAVKASEPVASTSRRHATGTLGVDLIVDTNSEGGAPSAAVGQDCKGKEDVTRGVGGDPMRLRHWHRLLRAAAAGGWRDHVLANRALDAVLREVRSTRRAWLTAVRVRAEERAAAAAAATGPEELPYAASLPSQISQPSSTMVKGAWVEAEQGEDEEGNSLGGAASGYDTAAGDVAGVIHTAALLGLHGRLDVVEAVVFGLLEALRAAEDGLMPAQWQAQPLPLGGPGSPSPGKQLRPHDVVALSPKALEQLQSGLEHFSPVLQMMESRRTRIAVHVLRQRLGLWEKDNGDGAIGRAT
ncbi:hypothetical protein Vafri_1559 [Volvox africanus]|nr:hypothetical protein Vafri_1559 [Volvox africanus]